MSTPHRRRLAAAVGGLGAAALILGGLSVVAPADAYVGLPGTGAAPSAYGPDLVGAHTTAVANQVEYCFDEAVKSPVTGDFLVRAYDAGRAYVATSVAASPSSTSCLDATFKAGSEIGSRGTTAYVTGGAVTDAAGLTAVGESAPLSGSTVAPRKGQSSGPDLVAARVDPSNAKEVTFTFDQNVQGKALITATRLGAIDADGTTTAATGLDATTPTSGHSVNVVFAAAQTSAVGFYAAQGAVRSTEFDAGGTAGPDASCDLLASDGKTPDCKAAPGTYGVLYTKAVGFPRLSGASYSAGNVTLTWSGAVAASAATAGRVFAILDNGNAVAATGLVRSSGASAVYSFGPPVTTDPSSVVAYVAWGSAVTYTASNGTTGHSLPASRIDTQAAPFSIGRTSGPDLERVTLNTAAQQATFTYDEPVAPSSATNPGAFGLLFGSAARVGGSAASTPSVSGSSVTVSYTGSIANAVGAQSSGGTDLIGNPANQGSVSTRLLGGTVSPAGHGTSACSTAKAQVRSLAKRLHRAAHHHHRAAVKRLRKRLHAARRHARAVC